MLRCSNYWHVASNLTPERERRLLWFAKEISTEELARLRAEAMSPPPEGQPQPGQEAVSTTQDQTRATVQDTLEQPHSDGEDAEAKDSMRKLLERATKVETSLQGTVAALKEFNAKAKGQLQGEQRKTWDDNFEFLRLSLGEIETLKRAVGRLADWESGAIPPVQLLQLFEDNRLARATRLTSEEREDDLSPEQREAHLAKRELYRNMHRALPRGDPAGQAWETGNVDTQLLAVRAFEERPVLREDDGETHTFGDIIEMLRNDIDNQLAAWEEALAIAKIELETLQKAFAQAEQERAVEEGGSILENLRNARNAVPIRFYSIYEIWEAGKSVVAAYKETYKQHVQLRSAIVAKKMGKVISFLPWGGDIEQILDREVDERNEGIVSKYSEYLKGRNASYKDIFDSNGELARNRHDGNRARGVLDYAASRGWLLDIDFNTKTSNGTPGFRLMDGRVLSYSDLVPKDWKKSRIDDAYSKLITAHNTGKTEESAKYEKRYHNIDRTADFARLVDDELSNYNIWAVHGIIKRSIERGLDGEVSAWHAVKIMQRIEADPKLKRIITRDWLDQIGILSYYRSAFVLGAFKYGRNKGLSDWCEGSDTNIENAGVFGKLINTVRSDIKQRTGRNFASDKERAELERLTAQVIAAQTIDIKDQSGNTQTFSIFEERYRFFREHEFIHSLGDLDPGVSKEDPDYFTNICENLIIGQRPVKNILARTGQGTWAEPEKVSHYIGNILYTYQRLYEKGQNEAAETLRLEMGQKVTMAMMEQAFGDSRTSGMSDLRTGGNMPGKAAMKELVTKGFLDIEPIVQTVWNDDANTGTGLARKLLRSIDEKLLDRLVELTESNKKASAADKSKFRTRYENIVAQWKAKQPNIGWPRGSYMDKDI